MPAQKLTKGRLAQILIMLSLLVTAFMWRSLSHQSTRTVDCSQKIRCDVTIGGEKITIKQNRGEISIQSAENSRLKIDPNQAGALQSLSNNDGNLRTIIIPEDRVVQLRLDGQIVDVKL
ncbi:hypothetical protein [Vibrio sp. CAU 1672]|uniref:hypothetical protein n=1 Tax=Vibrio sp. CAU 1672 TaxID=3032594 RepID=UPI0023DB9577|nr:hypothetical protein [Vibrio sp. CAU 1672]MDF2152180.1 hypothetical protein [Vibrio sp. CAU 1672]